MSPETVEARKLIASVIRSELGLRPRAKPSKCKCGRKKRMDAQICRTCRRTCPDCRGPKSPDGARCRSCSYQVQDQRSPAAYNGGKGTLVSPNGQAVRLCMSITQAQYERFLVLAQRTGIRRSELLGGWIDSEFVEGEKA